MPKLTAALPNSAFWFLANCTAASAGLTDRLNRRDPQAETTKRRQQLRLCSTFRAFAREP